MIVLNDFVAAVVVVSRIGLSSWWTTRKTMTMNILAVVVAVEVTKTTTIMMTMTMITAKERRRI